MDAAARADIAINEKKTLLSQSKIRLLGYEVSSGCTKPDSSRVQPLFNWPTPQNAKELQRMIGLFAYYARWVANYSDEVRPLLKSETFPLPENAVNAIKVLKQSLASATLQPIDFSLPFTVETDASEFAIAATFNQERRAVAFHSPTLSASEKRHSSVEKEAYAIVEALRKWRHFTLITDHKSLLFMFDTRHSSKIKNEILRWRLELSCFSYSIIHRPGCDNVGPNTLTRGFCGSIGNNDLRDLHDALCRSGITRLAHFVPSKNLPYSINDIRQMTSNREVCLKLKPKFPPPTDVSLIKATQVFERLNLDFKGPLPSTSNNKYFLTVIDEYSRFPFAFQ